jgi:4-diphosphocytidyl-2-C-methyl-D-erythritol kinase
MKKVAIQANAKINLSLSVRCKRADGYHEIESVIQEIDFGDLLDLRSSDKTVFTTDSKVLQAETGNLCLRAARLIQEEYQFPGIKMHLVKKIPIGAGLGGGSSDAAATLKGINAMYNLGLDDLKLRLLAAKLGSDVPFFIPGGSACVQGRGEILQPVEIGTDYTIVLVHPEVSINTTWAYANMKMGLTKEIKEPKFIGFEFQNLKVDDFRGKFHNDFEKPVFAVYPQLSEIKELLYREGAGFASMSGSGSTIYGLFENRGKAKLVYTELKSRYFCTLARPVKR